MIAHPNCSPLTPEEYLQLEEKAEFKHEYIEGGVYAMAGATDTDVTILLNLAAGRLSHLRGSDGRIYTADMKTRLEEKNRFFYPDILVTCDPRDRKLFSINDFLV